MKVLCQGSGRPGITLSDSLYAHCPACEREFSAQGRKAQARIGNPWQAIPKHYTETARSSRIGDVPVDDINGALEARLAR
jgi:hypothetical protein